MHSSTKRTFSPSMPHRILLWLVASVLLLNHATAKEMIATNDWQRVGPSDTLPAGMEIRIDITTGDKWARLLQPEETHHHDEPQHPRCGPSCKARQSQRRRARLRGTTSEQAAVVDRPQPVHSHVLLPLLLVGAVVATVVFRGLVHGGWRRRFWPRRALARES